MVSPSLARQKCFQAASAICNLLTTYRRHYGLKRAHIQMVHVIMTAALIHTYYCCLFAGKEGKGAQELLLTCMQALGEMGQTYRSASRALEMVTSLRNDWRIEVFMGLGGKRPSEDLLSQSQSANQRPRLVSDVSGRGY